MALSTKILKFILFAICISCFVLQVRDHVLKYFSKSTTQVTQTIKPTSLRFPSFALCSAKSFKLNEMAKLGLPPNYWFEFVSPKPLLPKDRDEAIQWWNKSTYNANDIVLSVMYGNFTSAINLEAKFNELHNPYMGNCFEFSLSIETDSTDMFLFIILNNITKWELPKLVVYPENTGALTISSQMWDTVTSWQANIGERSLTWIALSKTIFHMSETDNCNNDYMDCLVKEVNKVFNCFSPESLPYTNGQKVCNSSVNWLVVKREVSRIKYNGVCGQLCSHVEFSPNKINNQIEAMYELGNFSYLALSYSTLFVKESKEVLLHDFNSIVSSIGGSLGLFLGFSCLGTAVALVNWLMDKL